MISDALGIVNQESFAKALQKARDGREIQIVPMMHTLMIESWLRHFNKWNACPF
jgi:valyl-tRNA synthetase